MDRALQLFPASATVRLSSMSERALPYLKADLHHKILVVAEAAGLSQGTGAYLLRSLISEGRLCHATVDTANGLEGKMFEREGPTGLLVTTTRNQLDLELETRLFSIPIDDSPHQTAAIMQARALKAAGGATRQAPDLVPWHALQEWLEHAEHRVIIPYAHALAKTIPPVAVRLRRDFEALLTLVQAHAMLHQASRHLDPEGRTVAEPDDYAAVYELVYDLVAEGVEATVPRSVRETVEAVKLLGGRQLDGVSLPALAAELGLDKSTASRRATAAIELCYLRNDEARLGRPARYAPDQPMPVETEILPRPEALAERCTVARCAGGEEDVLDPGGRAADLAPA
jgi:hypothetical protein